MEEQEFSCSECGYTLNGPSLALSMTIECPNCHDTLGPTTAYPTN